MFFNIMDFLKTLFFLSWTSVCIQNLEATIWAIKCDGEVIISLPSLDKWANEVGQLSFGALSMMYD
jgi:hypothetical protein